MHIGWISVSCKVLYNDRMMLSHWFKSAADIADQYLLLAMPDAIAASFLVQQLDRLDRHRRIHCLQHVVQRQQAH